MTNKKIKINQNMFRVDI